MEKAKRKLLAFLTTGLTPEQLAMCVALGIALGIVPALGTATLLCALAAFALRLNFAAMQLVNYFIYPVQLALLIPFFRAGEWMFGSQHRELSVEKIRRLLEVDVWAAVFSLWTTVLHAVTAWLLVAPVILVAAYFSLLPLMRKLNLERVAPGAAAEPEI